MINKWAICCNKQVAFLSRGEIRPLILVRVAETRTIYVIPFCRLDTRCPAYFHFQVVKKTTWFWWWSLRPPPFLPFGTMLRNNIKEIPTLFRNFSTLFRKHISLDFQVIKRITWFQVLILRTWSVKWCGLGRGDPPQNQWVKMDHWFLSEQYRKKSLVLFRI